jgi:glycosyltransferase involved in cell wall biosynthesis
METQSQQRSIAADEQATTFDRDAATSSLLVGIPAYNEEVGIGSVVLAAQRFTDDVVVVDDGSSDRTVPIARESGATVIVHEENKGKGGAMRTLFDHAQRHGYETLVVLDGDGQHVPADIPQVVEPVLEGEADMVIGSRYLDGAGDDETPLYRRFGQKVLDHFTVGSADADITDTQSGFRALSATAIEELTITADGMSVESEMISDAVDRGLEIQEAPIDVRYEGIDGQTHNPLRHGLGVLHFLVTLVRDRHPLLFFALPGVLFTVGGALYGLDSILIYQSTGNFYPAKVLVSGFATILGVLGVFTGLTLNQVARMIDSIERSE